MIIVIVSEVIKTSVRHYRDSRETVKKRMLLGGGLVGCGAYKDMMR